MKTGNVNSGRPSGDSGAAKRTEQKKPQKEFKEVLQQSGGKQQLSKGKPFSPLSQKPTLSSKSSAKEKSSTQQAKGEQSVSGEKSALTQPREHQRIEGKADRDTADTDHQYGGSHGQEEILQPMQPQQIQGMPNAQGLSAVQDVGSLSKVGGPALRIDELQNIVQKVDVGVNEQGLPEFRFELQTEKLGSLDLKVSAENDQIRIEFAVDDARAQQKLEENLTELKQMLQDKGLNLAETRFTSRDQREDKDEQSGQQGDSQYSGNNEKKKKFSL